MISLYTDPRMIQEKDFPHEAPPHEKWRFLLNYALLAPSEYNVQPWLFQIHGKVVELYADADRHLSVVDSDQREMVIACSAAFLNLRIALRHFGYREETYVPSALGPPPHQLIAKIRMAEPFQCSEYDHLLFSAITRRTTNRHIFDERPIPAEILEQIEQRAAVGGCWVRSLQSDDLRTALEELIVEGDRQQWASPAFREELARWVRGRDAGFSDGLPAAARGKGSIAGTNNAFVVRTFDLWRAEAWKTRRLATGAPVLAVLGTISDTPGDWFAVGQTMERLLLYAYASGLQASFVNQPIELPGLRQRLNSIIHSTGYPQLILRVGYGPPASLTPRRTLADVLLEIQPEQEHGDFI
ncbi:hypothetical protein KDA_56440 [Dictyobacter alpinus]|uniref:Uncharacterized protein n=1 Tax=Dictyobacter alpinus TaxID=2014873 RepID=A0A402BFV2_9CHLR|nr:nitroreductase family protein [Dictyobacter alpinus]GCE30160.1 hypothetical protein KDA_56440 [Dictyobacter alpinus]